MSRLRANQITNENANGAPNFPHGITVTGIVTASTASTTMDQIVVGSAVTANSQGVDVTGIVTATSFKGDGSNLTGIDSSALSSGGSVKVQANSHGAVTTGVHTATSFSGSGAGLTGTGKVIKYALATSTSVDQYGAQNSYTLVGPQLTYTGTSASNKLLIHHNHHLVIEQPSDWYMALWRDGTSGTKLVEKKWYGQDAQWIGHTGIHVCVVDIPDTSSHTYQFAIYRTSSTNRMVYNHSVGVTQIIALEIDPS